MEDLGGPLESESRFVDASVKRARVSIVRSRLPVVFYASLKGYNQHYV